MSSPTSRIELVPLGHEHFADIIALADREIGANYYTEETLNEQADRSSFCGQQLSFLAFDGPTLVGFRLTSAPGKWTHGRGKGLSPEKWPFAIEEAAYFQSCFVSHGAMGKGIGQQLSRESLRHLALLGVPLVVAHSWKESPHNSSFRYLSKLGFVPVSEYPEYWVDVDYTCSLDGNPCRCTAIEMILTLDAQAPS